MDTAQDTSGIALIVILSVLAIATTITVARIYTRIYLIKQLGLDDYCVVVSLLFAIGTGATVLSTIPYGLGRHTSTLSLDLIPKYLFSFYMSIVLYNITLALIKLTFMFQYYRVLAVHKMKRVIWIFGAVIMAWAVSQVLVVAFSCTPVQKFWMPQLEGSCIPNLPFWYINAAGNITTDLIVFILPLPVLSRLQLRRKQRYILIGIFSLGFFTCAISLIRLAYLKQGPDFTYDNVPTSCWSVSEVACAISCACLPTLKPLISKIKPQWITSYARSKAGRNTGTGKFQGHGKSGFEEGTELRNTHRSQSHSVPDSVKTLSSTMKSKTYTMIDDVDIEQGLPTAPPSAAAHAHIHGRNHEFDDLHADRDRDRDRDLDLPTKQSMPSIRFSKDPRAMEVLGMGMGMGMTGVSTHVSSGNTSPGLTSFLHPESPHREEHFRQTSSPVPGIEVKRSVTVETIQTPQTPHNTRRTQPREF